MAFTPKYKLLDWIPEDRINWGRLSSNPKMRYIYWKKIRIKLIGGNYLLIRMRYIY